MPTTFADTGAPVLDIHGAFVRRTNLSGASLRHANLSGADASGANFEGADFHKANLDGTILSGANLSGARNLTLEQLSKAVIDRHTLLPSYIDRRKLKSRSAAESTAKKARSK